MHFFVDNQYGPYYSLFMNTAHTPITPFLAASYTRLRARFHSSTVERHEGRWMAACWQRWEDVQRVAYLTSVQPRRTR